MAGPAIMPGFRGWEMPGPMDAAGIERKGGGPESTGRVNGRAGVGIGPAKVSGTPSAGVGPGVSGWAIGGRGAVGMSGEGRAASAGGSAAGWPGMRSGWKVRPAAAACCGGSGAGGMEMTGGGVTWTAGVAPAERGGGTGVSEPARCSTGALGGRGMICG